MESRHRSVEEYFSSLNPIAKRIYEDVISTRESYESAWNRLKLDEQHQVINESLIYPDAVLKYSLSPLNVDSKNPVESFPKLKLSYGSKVIQDECGLQWRDEHSAPFTWKTLSQLNIEIPPDTISVTIEQKPETKKKRPPVPPPKPPKNEAVQSSSPMQKPMLQEDVLHHNPTNSFVEDANTNNESESESSSLQGIPKTGFEFLDNW